MSKLLALSVQKLTSKVKVKVKPPISRQEKTVDHIKTRHIQDSLIFQRKVVKKQPHFSTK